MLTFVAAPLALLHSSRRLVLFFVVSTAVAVSVAYGVGPAFWLAQHLPILKFIKNERLVLVSSFSLAVLAGLGVSVLEGLQLSPAWRRRLGVAMLAGSGFTVSFVMIYTIHLRTEK